MDAMEKNMEEMMVMIRALASTPPSTAMSVSSTAAPAPHSLSISSPVAPAVVGSTSSSSTGADATTTRILEKAKPQKFSYKAKSTFGDRDEDIHVLDFVETFERSMELELRSSWTFEAVSHFNNQLHGRAQKWFLKNAKVLYGSDLHDPSGWKRVRDAFVKEFDDPNFEQRQIAKFLDLRMSNCDDNFLAYVNKFDELLDALDLRIPATFNYFRIVFQRGLPTHLARKLAEMDDDFGRDYDAYFARARQVHSTLETVSVRNAGTSQNKSGSRRDHQGPGRSSPGDSPSDSTTRTSSKSTEPSRRRDPSPGPGHMMRGRSRQPIAGGSSPGVSGSGQQRASSVAPPQQSPSSSAPPSNSASSSQAMISQQQQSKKAGQQ